MSLHPNLASLTGKWEGTNKLNLPWLPDPVVESRSTADIQFRALEQAIEIVYKWEYEGKPQEGVIMISTNKNSDQTTAVWTDSWHSANVLMVCIGTVSNEGTVNVKGSYSVPDHPDWGWRTEILPKGDTFKYLMFNVSPEGEETWAVETEFRKIM